MCDEAATRTPNRRLAQSPAFGPSLLGNCSSLVPPGSDTVLIWHQGTFWHPKTYGYGKDALDFGGFEGLPSTGHHLGLVLVGDPESENDQQRIRKVDAHTSKAGKQLNSKLVHHQL